MIQIWSMPTRMSSAPVGHHNVSRTRPTRILCKHGMDTEQTPAVGATVGAKADALSNLNRKAKRATDF